MWSQVGAHMRILVGLLSCQMRPFNGGNQGIIINVKLVDTRE